MAPASLGAPAPTYPGDTPIDLHALYQQNAACGYTHPIELRPHHAQSIAMHLRGIQGVASVLVAASDSEMIELSAWMRAGLIEAITALADSATTTLDSLNERAAQAQGAQA